MPTLTGGLQTVDNGTQGWNDVHNDNWELIDDRCKNAFLATKRFGTDAVANESTTQSDPNATTAETLTDSSGGTPSNTIPDVGVSFNQGTLNNIVASLVDEINKLRADNVELRTKLIGTIDYCDALKAKTNAILAALRKTNGCGVLSD